MSTALIPTKEEFEVIEQISKHAVQSKFVEKLGGLSGVITIAMYSREMGVSPLVGIMGGFSNIQGKITMSSELMNSLIRRAGHKMNIERCDNEVCTIKGERIDTKETATVSFTMAEAKAAGLVKSGGAWEKYTSDMLFARCLSRLRRRLFPDIATKSYVEGELDEEAPAKGPIDITPNVEVTKLTEPPVVEKISVEEWEMLKSLIGSDTDYLQKLLEWRKVDSLENLPRRIYPTVLAHLKSHNEKKYQAQGEVF